MVRWSDLVVCNSVHIESFIHQCYDGKGLHEKNPNTTYIAYSAEIPERSAPSRTLQNWYDQHGLTPGNNYLIVSRLVPENNYETMMQEFIASDTSRSLAIVTNSSGKFLAQLEQKLCFQSNSRIKLDGSVYNQELLAAICQNAFAYLHGHEVGSTNSSRWKP